MVPSTDELAIASKEIKEVEEYTVARSNVIEDLFKVSFAYDSAERIRENGYLRTQLTSELVGNFIQGVKCNYDTVCPALSRVYLEDDVKMKIEVLKYYTYETHIEGTRLKTVEFRGKEIVRSIFHFLRTDKKNVLLPEDWRERAEGTNDERLRLRCISDFVASMTDRYAIEFYQKLSTGGVGYTGNDFEPDKLHAAHPSRWSPNIRVTGVHARTSAFPAPGPVMPRLERATVGIARAPIPRCLGAR